jgi:hypothetical protein
MIRLAPVVLLAGGCWTGSGFECPEPPPEPNEGLFEVDLDGALDDRPDGILEVGPTEVVLVYEDEDGTRWRVSWPREP